MDVSGLIGRLIASEVQFTTFGFLLRNKLGC